jgi:hypothetical protein
MEENPRGTGCSSSGIRLSAPKSDLATGPTQKVRRAKCMGCVLSASGVPRQVMNDPVAGLKKVKTRQHAITSSRSPRHCTRDWFGSLSIGLLRIQVRDVQFHMQDN